MNFEYHSQVLLHAGLAGGVEQVHNFDFCARTCFCNFLN